MATPTTPNLFANVVATIGIGNGNTGQYLGIIRAHTPPYDVTGFCVIDEEQGVRIDLARPSALAQALTRELRLSQPEATLAPDDDGQPEPATDAGYMAAALARLATATTEAVEARVRLVTALADAEADRLRIETERLDALTEALTR